MTLQARGPRFVGLDVGAWCAQIAIALVISGSLLFAADARAHDFSLTDVLLVVRGDGRIQADMIVDLDALAVGAPQGTGSQGHDGLVLAERLRGLNEEELASLRASLLRIFERRVRLRVDGSPVSARISFPDEGRDWVPRVEPPPADVDGVVPSPVDGEGGAQAQSSSRIEDASPSYFGVTARLEVLAPQDAETVSFFASRAFRAVHLSVLQQRARTVERQVLAPGEESRDFELSLAMTPPDFDSEAGRGTGLEPASNFLDFLRLGILHIVPRGLDHVLFVFSLCLLSTRWQDLAIWVTSFTLAHTVSLALASKNLLVASPSLVEPLIALSIGWVAFRAWWRVRPTGSTDVVAKKEWRGEAALVFGLGLLHGFGFAGVLRGIGLPAEGWLLALAGFNLGVEVGQLVVLLAGLAVVLALGRLTRRRRLIVTAAAWALMAVSVWWTLGRIGWIPESL